MNSKSFQHIEMLSRVVEFGTTHVDLFPKNTLAGETFATLGTMLSKLSEQASAQVSSKSAVRAGSKVRATAREAVRQQLQRVSNTAAAIAIDTPGLDGKFRLTGIDRRRDRGLIQCGKAFAEEAESMRDAFQKHHLPIEKLNAAVADLEAAVSQSVSTKGRRANDTKAIDDSMAECLTLLQRVDAVVLNTLADNPHLTAEWNIRRRVGRTPARAAEQAA